LGVSCERKIKSWSDKHSRESIERTEGNKFFHSFGFIDFNWESATSEFISSSQRICNFPPAFPLSVRCVHCVHCVHCVPERGCRRTYGPALDESQLKTFHWKERVRSLRGGKPRGSLCDVNIAQKASNKPCVPIVYKNCAELGRKDPRGTEDTEGPVKISATIFHAPGMMYLGDILSLARKICIDSPHANSSI
jgi:hypothetical protein